jgi:hypothetical protein
VAFLNRADPMKLSEAVAKAKERFGMPASARVVIETWRRRYNHVRPTQPAGSGHEVNI